MSGSGLWELVPVDRTYERANFLSVSTTRVLGVGMHTSWLIGFAHGIHNLHVVLVAGHQGSLRTEVYGHAVFCF